MRFRRALAVAIVALAVFVAAPATASADWLFTPFIGGNMGGDTDGTKLNYGGSFGYMSEGIFGFEVDLGYSPDFFETASGVHFTDDSNVTTLMGNVIIGAPTGGVRPYVAAGAGLLRTNLGDAGDLFADFNERSWGFNLGAGVLGFVTDNVGLRGDVRYFRGLDTDEPDGPLDLTDFDFWRTTVGVTFRF